MNQDFRRVENYMHSVMGILTDFATDAVRNGKIDDSGYWTKQITLRLCERGVSFGFEAYAAGHGGEWLYDLCWVKRNSDITQRLPLVLECEWERSQDQIEDDFEKLLWSKADLRVMIFDATFKSRTEGYAKQWAKNKIESLRGRIQAFEGTEEGDAYLFFVWCDDKSGCGWYRDGGEYLGSGFINIG